MALALILTLVLALVRNIITFSKVRLLVLNQPIREVEIHHHNLTLKTKFWFTSKFVDFGSFLRSWRHAGCMERRSLSRPRSTKYELKGSHGDPLYAHFRFNMFLEYFACLYLRTVFNMKIWAAKGSEPLTSPSQEVQWTADTYAKQKSVFQFLHVFFINLICFNNLNGLFNKSAPDLRLGSAAGCLQRCAMQKPLAVAQAALAVIPTLANVLEQSADPSLMGLEACEN